jgi:hypothetical protein
VGLLRPHPAVLFSPTIIGLFTHIQRTEYLHRGLALAEHDLRISELADDLFEDEAFSEHLDLSPFLILTQSLDQVLDSRSVSLIAVAARRD